METMKRVKRRKKSRKINYIIILIIMFIVALSCFLESRGKAYKKEDGTVCVALVPQQGLIIKSENPITIKKGDSVNFDIDFEEGYSHRDSDLYNFKDGKLTYENICSDMNLYYIPHKECTVKVEKNDRGKIKLVSHKKVTDGEEAVVKITPYEHYQVESVLVNNRTYPAPAGDKFKFIVEKDSVVKVNFTGENVSFMVISNGLGNIKTENDSGVFHYGDEIDLSCEYDSENIKFSGWSTGGYLDEGGELYGKDKKITFHIKGDTILYANLKDMKTYDVVIDGNGDDAASEITLGGQSPYTNIYLPVDEGRLVRDGYLLTGYNSRKDGKGTQYSLGSMMRMPRENVTLYAEWEKCIESEKLLYTNNGSGITINGLAENVDNNIGDMLCLPDKIDGVQVNVIADGAFHDTDNIKTVIVPVGVTYIGQSSFAQCDKLKMVYLPETLAELASNAFENTPEFTQLKILASLQKVYDYDFDSAYADKYMRLKTTEGKRIILAGGSSYVFGMDSAMLSQKFTDYTVVNMGGSYLYGILPMFDVLKANVREGDIVIFAPEYYSMMYGNEQCSNFSNWQYLESNYDILNDINIQDNGSILAYYTRYLARKREILPDKFKNSNSIYARAGMNEFGDLILQRENLGIYYPEIPSLELLNGSGIENYNNTCRELTKKGAICLFSFPPVSDGGMTKEQIKELTSQFMAELKAKLNSKYCTIISNFEDCAFEGNLFHDNCYHMTLEGARIRTKQLIKDIENWGGIK